MRVCVFIFDCEFGTGADSLGGVSVCACLCLFSGGRKARKESIWMGSAY